MEDETQEINPSQSSQLTIPATSFSKQYDVGLESVVDSLTPPNYLDDNLIDKYVHGLFAEHHVSEKYVYIPLYISKPAYFPKQVVERVPTALNYISNLKATIKNSEFLLIPLHIQIPPHYFLICVQISKKIMTIYNSIAGAKYENWFDRTHEVFEFPKFDWTHNVEKCPQQENGYDCGFYVIHFVLAISGITSLCPFTDLHANSLRKHMFQYFFPAEELPKALLDLCCFPYKGVCSPDNDESDCSNSSTDEDDGTDNESSSTTKNKTPRKKVAATGSFDNSKFPYLNIHRLHDDFWKSNPLNPSTNSTTSEKLEHFLIQKKLNEKSKNPFIFRRQLSLEVEGLAFVFSRKTAKGKDRVLRILGVEETASTITSALIILKFPTNMFAITSGNAWKSVIKFTDYKFQQTIPERILDPEGVVCLKVTPVFGTLRSKSLESYKKISLRDLEVGDVCRSFTGTLSANYITNFFPNLENKGLKVVVKVGVGRIKFNMKLTFKELTKVCLNLELVYQDALINRMVIPSKLTQIIQQTDKIVACQLTKELESRLENSFKNQSFASNFINNFDVCPSNSLEYTEANSVHITIDRKGQDIEPNPSLVIILETAHTLHNPTVGYKKLCHRISLSYSNQNKVYKLKLSQLLRGPFYSNAYKRNFFRISNCWYFIAEELILRVQHEFQEILENHLLKHGQPRSLKKKWDHSWKKNPKGDQFLHPIQEKHFNMLYNSKELISYFVGDERTPYEVELFDIMKVSNRSTASYLYHVKHGFGGSNTSVACAQLYRAAAYIRDYDRDEHISEKDTVVLNKYEKTLTQESRFVEGKLTTRENFLEHVGMKGRDKRLPVFVLTLLTNPSLQQAVPDSQVQLPKLKLLLTDKAATRSLQLEKLVKLTFFTSDLDANLTEYKQMLAIGIGCTELQVVEKVLDFLENNNFISINSIGTNKNNEYSVLSKLLLTPTIKDFIPLFPQRTKSASIDCSRNLCLALQSYASFFSSLGAKIEVIRLSKALQDLKLKPKQFKICELLSNITGCKIKKEKKPKPITK